MILCSNQLTLSIRVAYCPWLFVRYPLKYLKCIWNMYFHLVLCSYFVRYWTSRDYKNKTWFNKFHFLFVKIENNCTWSTFFLSTFLNRFSTWHPWKWLNWLPLFRGERGEGVFKVFWNMHKNFQNLLKWAENSQDSGVKEKKNLIPDPSIW